MSFQFSPAYGGMRKVKKIKELRGGVHLYAAQMIPKIDAEIAEKCHFWMETSYLSFSYLWLSLSSWDNFNFMMFAQSPFMFYTLLF